MRPAVVLLAVIFTLAAVPAMAEMTSQPFSAPMNAPVAGSSSDMGTSVNPNMGSKVGAGGAPSVGLRRTEELPDRIDTLNSSGSVPAVVTPPAGDSKSMFDRNGDIPERTWVDERREERKQEEEAEKQKEADEKADEKAKEKAKKDGAEPPPAMVVPPTGKIEPY